MTFYLILFLDWTSLFNYLTVFLIDFDNFDFESYYSTVSLTMAKSYSILFYSASPFISSTVFLKLDLIKDNFC